MQIVPTTLALAAVLALLFGGSSASRPEPRHQPQAQPQSTSAPAIPPGSLFATADQCMACHNNLVSPSGRDISIGYEWRSSMMANAARDPYWHAGVRREVLDHPEAAEAIQHECSACHMPMMRYEAKVNGRLGQVFAHLPITTAAGRPTETVMAADGVSCTVCHQAGKEKLGTKDSFNAGFVVDHTLAPGPRRVFGPYLVDNGRARVMRSASTFAPTEAAHIQSSEVCATCHTLFTHTLGPGGKAIGELPEQVPYLEWRHSDYVKEKSCQGCHMPVEDGEVPIASVVGQPRPHMSRHEFRGGNFFMPMMLNRYRQELGVAALTQELDATARNAIETLETESARLDIERVGLRDGRLTAVVAIENLAGHKLPSAYPSRRAWLHVTISGANGRTVFESGAFQRNGSIAGNDNDADATTFEPHYAEIGSGDQVQIYEPVMVDQHGAVTTGLLHGFRYVKDNRILPRGFDKATADKDVAVHGEAAADPDFLGGSDRVRYIVDVGQAQGPFEVRAELYYQSVGYRWAQNSRRDTAEGSRFIRYFDSMASASSAILAKAATTVK
jgi:cytochrome c551/c552